MKIRQTQSNENVIYGDILERDIVIGSFELIHDEDYYVDEINYYIGSLEVNETDNPGIVEVLDKKVYGLCRNLREAAERNYDELSNQVLIELTFDQNTDAMTQLKRNVGRLEGQIDATKVLFNLQNLMNDE